MNKNQLAALAVLTVGSVNAQEVISTQGDYYESSSGSVSVTVGEVVTNTVSDGTTDLTQGFQQSSWNFLSTENYDIEYAAVLFPNPTTETLNIQASDFEKVTYSIYDAQGKLVQTGVLSSTVTPINVAKYAQGNYSVTLTNENQEKLKTFKLIKL